MDWNTVYTKTAKGVLQLSNKTLRLPRDVTHVLTLVDGKASIAELLLNSGRLSEAKLYKALDTLTGEGLIKILVTSPDTEFSHDVHFSDSIQVSELDTQAFFDAKEEAEARVKQRANAVENKVTVQSTAKAAAEAALARAEAGAKILADIQAKKAKEDAAVKATLAEKKAREAEMQARAMKEEEARLLALAKARQDAKAKEEAIQKANREAAAEKAKQEVDAQARAKAEAKAREEAEAEARRKMRLEARAREEAEAAALATKQAEEQARQEILAREQAEAKAKAELQAKHEAEQRAHAEAQEKARVAAEEKARLAEEAKARAEAAALEKKQAEEKARQEIRARKEAEAKAAAEQKAKQEAERIRAETEAKAQAIAEAKARIEATALAKKQAEAKAQQDARAREEAQIKASQEAEQRARAAAEAEAQAANEKARIEAENQARAEAVAKKAAEEKAAQEEAEANAQLQAKQEAERLADAEAQLAAEQKARLEAESRARADSDELARLEDVARSVAEERERLVAEAKANAQAEAKAILDAEARARVADKQRVKQEAAAAKVAEKAAAKIRKKQEAEDKAADKADQLRLAKQRNEARIEERSAGYSAPTVLVKKSKKPVHWVRGTVVTLLLLLALPLLAIFSLPLTFYAPQLEKILSDGIGEPVTIGTMRASLLPVPHLKLGQVAIGRLQDIHMETVQLVPEWRTLTEEKMKLKALDVDSVRLDQEVLPRLPHWLKSLAKVQRFQVNDLHFRNVQLTLKEIEPFKFDADIRLSESGEFQRAVLTGTDGKLDADVLAQGENYQVTISGKNWQPPIGPRFTWDEIHVKGIATATGMQIDEVMGTLYGGSVAGNAKLSWQDQWRLAGEFNAKNLQLQMMMPLFTHDIAASGALRATGSYAMQNASLAHLFDTPTITASFNLTEGAVGGIDLVRAIQFPEKSGLRGGQTQFSDLTGSLQLSNKRYQFAKLKLIRGMLNAYGVANISPAKELTGRLNAQLGSKGSVEKAAIKLSGSASDPILLPLGGRAVIAPGATDTPSPSEDQSRPVDQQ